MKFANIVPLIGICLAVPPVSHMNSALSGAAAGVQPGHVSGPKQRTSKSTVSSGNGIASTQISGLNFASTVPYGSGGHYPQFVTIADVNGDGKPDLIVANNCQPCSNNEGSVAVLLGNGDGTFQTPVSYDSGGEHAWAVAAADVNGDGKPDLVVVNVLDPTSSLGDGSIAVLLNNGDGTFQAAATYDSQGVAAYAVAAADVNGDGKPDLLVANNCADNTCTSSGTVAVLMGNGDGTFQPGTVYNSGGLQTYALTVADVNRDGKPDILVVNYCGPVDCEYGKNGTVSILLGNGDGSFRLASVSNSGGYFVTSVAAADINGDGKPDVVVANQCEDNNCLTSGAVGVLLGNGDGTLQAAVTYASGGYLPYAIAIADVNGDGQPDLAIANLCGSSISCNGGSNTVGVLLGNGDGTFQSAITYDSGGQQQSYSIAAGDVNGDGKPDVAITNACADATCVNGSIGVLINTSSGGITNSALGSSVNPSKFDQSVTFTATVSSAGFKGTPSGTVGFLDGTATLGTAQLNSVGVATFVTSTLAIGTHPITASYNGDTNFAPSTSPVVSQLVQSPKVSLSTTSLNFGNQTVRISSAAQNVTLKNVGNLALTINSINISGTNIGDFSQTNNCGTSVAAGASCTISVIFTPIATGARSASVTITDNGPKGTQTISLSGTGVKPAVKLAPTSLTFPTQVVFTTSKVKTVTLSNTGLGLLELTTVSVTGPFAQTNTCGTTVNPGASCTFSITFKPTTIGPLTGSISITDNAPLSPQKISLSGTGTYIQLTPTSLNFGNQPVGTKSLPKKVTLSNKGSVTVNITSISITGTNASDFAQTNTCGTSVAAGASCFVTVTFTPSASGARSANVSVSDDGGGSPQKVKLVGTGT